MRVFRVLSTKAEALYDKNCFPLSTELIQMSFIVAKSSLFLLTWLQNVKPEIREGNNNNFCDPFQKRRIFIQPILHRPQYSCLKPGGTSCNLHEHEVWLAETVFVKPYCSNCSLSAGNVSSLFEERINRRSVFAVKESKASTTKGLWMSSWFLIFYNILRRSATDIKNSIDLILSLSFKWESNNHFHFSLPNCGISGNKLDPCSNVTTNIIMTSEVVAAIWMEIWRREPN